MAVVGYIARAHGIRGQVIVNAQTDFPEERFKIGSELFLKRPGTDRGVETVAITSVRFQQHRPVIGLAGVDDMNAATALAGSELRVPLDRLARLPKHTFYHHDLIGSEVVTAEGTVVGCVSSVEGTVSRSRLVVATPRGEVQVPLVSEICPTVDAVAKRIVIAPPPGLLEINETAKASQKAQGRSQRVKGRSVRTEGGSQSARDKVDKGNRG